MAKGFTYKMEIDADINALTSKLKTLKEALASVTSNGKEPKIARILNQLGTKIDNIKTKAATPVKSEAAFAGMEKEIQGIQRLLEALGMEITNVSKKTNAEKISLLPESEQKRLLAAVDAMKKYDSALDVSTKKSKELTEAERKQLAEEGKLTAKTKELEERRKSLVAAESRVNTAKIAKEAAEKRRDEANAAEEQYQKIKKLAEARKKEDPSIDLRKAKFDDGQGGQTTLAAARGKAQSAARAAEKDDLDALTQAYRNARDEAQNFQDSVNRLTVSVKNQESAAKIAADKVKELTTAFDANKLKASNDAFNELTRQAKDLGINLEGIGADNTPENVALLKQRMEEFVVQGIQPANDQLQQAVNITEQYRGAADAASESNKRETETFREQNEAAGEVDGIMSRIKQFTGLTGVALVMRRALQSAITTIKELDKQMTEMAVVTDLEVGDYWRQLPEHTAQANALGVAIKDVYEAETLYYQQGLKTAQVQKLSTSTLKMARIAGLSAEDATNKMTAALRGFNMEINETNADRIADVYSKLAAITASNVQEISSAMTKTASLASNAGMEFETTAAFLSQIIETTRESAETAGTALKTVIARFQELKKAPEEIGEVDGEIVDANKIETALRSVGVALRDTQGQFRNLDEVFLELSKKWDTLDTNTQRYIATIAAGSRQQSRFIAMMSNYARTQELVNAANRAAGASNEQFEKTLSSLESKLAQLKNAWDTFTQGLVNNEFVKIAVDVLTGILSVINEITTGWDNWSGAALKIGLVTTALILGDKALNAFRTSLSNGASVLQSANVGMKAINNTIINLGTSVGKVGQKLHQFSIEFSADQEFMKTAIGSAYADAIKAQQQYIAVQNSSIASDSVAEKIKGKYVEKLTAFGVAMGLDADQVGHLNDLVSLGIPIDQAALIAKQNLTEEDIRQRLAVEKLNGALSEEQLKKLGVASTDLGASLSSLGKRLTDFSTGGFTKFVTNLKTGFKDLGKGLATFFKTFGASIGYFTIALAILAIGIIGITHAVKALHKNSPAGQFEIATQRAKELGAAADTASEKFKTLNDTLKNFRTAQSNISTLIKGTREWKTAVQEVNKQYLDLIELYPKLAALETTTKNGYIEFVNQEAVDQVLNEAELTTQQTAIAAAAAKLDQRKKEQAVRFSELSDQAKVGDPSLAGLGALAGITYASALAGAGAGAGIGAGIGGIVVPVAGAAPGAGIGAAIGAGVGAVGGVITAFATGAVKDAKNAAEREQQILTDQFAKDLTESGTMSKQEIVNWLQSHSDTYKNDQVAADRIASEMYSVQAELKRYGEGLKELETANKVYLDTVRSNVFSLIDQTKYTDKVLQEMQGLMSSDFITSIEDKWANKVQRAGEQKSLDDPNSVLAQEYKDYFKKQYDDVTVTNKGEVKYTDSEGKAQTIDKETAWAAFSAAKAVKDLKEKLEILPKALDKVGGGVGSLNTAMHHALSDDQGLGLSKRDVQSFLNESDEIDRKTFTDMWKANADLRHLYDDNFTLFWNEMQTRIEGEQIAQKANAEKLAELVSKDFAFDDALTAGAEKGLVDHMTQVAAVATSEQAESLGNQINTLLSQVALEDRDKLASQLNAINWYDADALEKLPQTLKTLGYNVPTQALDDFINSAKETAQAVHNIDMSKLNESLREFTNILNEIRVNHQGRVFDANAYEKIIATDSTLITKFAQNLDGSYTFISSSLDDLTDAILGTTDAYIEEKKEILTNKRETRIWMDSQSQKGPDNDISKLVGYDSGSQEQRDFLKELIANSDIKDLKGISPYLSKNTLVEKLSNERVGQIISSLNAIDTVAALNEEWDSTLLKAQITKNLKQDAYYNTHMIDANNAAEGTASQDEIQNYQGQRIALILQAQAAGLSEKDLDLLYTYNEALKEMEDTLETDTDDYKKLAKATNKYMQIIATKTSFETMYQGLTENVEKSNELNESYQKTTSAMQQQQIVSEMMAEFGIKVTEKNYKQLAILTDNYLHGNKQGFIDLIEVAGKAAHITGENIFDTLADQTEAAITKMDGEWLNFATKMVNAGYARWDSETRQFKWGLDDMMSIIDDIGNSIEMWRSPYNWLYNANQQINAQLRERERLERAWKYAIEDNSKPLNDLADNLTEQINLTTIMAKEQKAIFNNAKGELQAYYNHIMNTQELSALKQAFAVGSNGQIVVNKTQLYNAKVTAETGSLIEEEIGKIESLLDTMRDAEDQIAEANDHLRELQKTGKEQYKNLLEDITEALRNNYQKQIDTLSAINDSISTAQEKLVDKLQEKIDDDRQAREDEKKQKNLQDKTTQLAYLRASGADPLSILKAEKELSNEQESYTDSLVDRSISELQKANQQAADQRQEQIDIAQAQYDWWSENTAIHDAEEILDASLKAIADGLAPEKTHVAELISEAQNIKAQGAKDVKDWWIDFESNAKLATIYEALDPKKSDGQFTIANGHLTDMAGALTDGESNITAYMKTVADGFSKALAGSETGLLTDKNINYYSTKGDDDIQNTIAGWNDKLNKIDRQTAPSSDSSDYPGSNIDISDNDEFIAETKRMANAHREERKLAFGQGGSSNDDSTRQNENNETGSTSLDVGKQSATNYASQSSESFDITNAAGLPYWMKITQQNGVTSISSKNKSWFDVATHKPDSYVIDEDGTRWALIPGTLEKDTNKSLGIFVDRSPTEWTQNQGEGFFDFFPGTKFKRFYNPDIKHFVTGGLANFTGPAWLDGTKSNPELVLNATDTANFIVLKDILSEIMRSSSASKSNEIWGNNYYNIDIHVDSIENDYDVDQAAERIKELITADAMYRNVNAVQQIR